MRLKSITSKTALWIGTATAVVPLVVLLLFQYRWLVSLEHASTIAQEHTLSNYLEAVTSEVQYHYARLGERGLNLPLALFDGRELDAAAALRYLNQRKLLGVQWVFLVREDGAAFDAGPAGSWQVPPRGAGDGLRIPIHGEDHLHGTDGTDGAAGPESPARPAGSVASVVFYDPTCGCWGEPPPEQVRAVQVAAAPWVMLAQQRTILESSGLNADERDPATRMIVNPILDDGRRVVGIAGMILDPDHFREHVLPDAIEKSLPHFFKESPLTHFVVHVADGGGELKYSTDCPDLGDVEPSASSLASTKPFSFVFRDWGVAVQSHGPTAEELAREHFMVNLGLSVMLGVVLVGGTVFTLRTASRELRLSQLKSDFISNVSHELRTPLASIQAFGELLRRGRVADAEKAAQYGGFIETESRRLGQLINNVLDFSRLESGGHAYLFERSDLASLVEAELATFAVRAREAGFVVSYQNRASDAIVVDADRQALGQAVGNLLDNAVKYSGSSRELRVWLERDRDRARIGIKDFGVGIAADEQEKIFERFHRITDGLVHDVQGTGLGLSIVQQIVAAHRGEVTVSSAPGMGSTFIVSLPIEAPSAAPKI
jgi:signal transduction histidine kinase